MAGTIIGRTLAALALVASLGLGGCQGEGDAETNTDTMPHDTNDTSLGAETTTGTDTMPGGPAPAGMSDANLVARLAAMDSAEIELGRLALEKATSADVKVYAQMMIDHHTAMKNEGAAMAQKEGITPVLQPDDPAPRDLATARDRLMATTSDAFDRAYIDQMIVDHQKAVATITSNMGTVQSPGLKAHMGNGLPKIQAHLEQAMQLQAKVGATASM